jgi:hypothetical protein
LAKPAHLLSTPTSRQVVVACWLAAHHHHRDELASSSSPSGNGMPLRFPSTPITNTLKHPPLPSVEPPPALHISTLLEPYKSHSDPNSLHHARFSLLFPLLAQEFDLIKHPSPPLFTTTASPNPLCAAVFFHQ